jgi:hypothetical protein
MMVVTPDGYVLEAEGLYYSDGLNNDAKILENMWYKPNSIISVLKSRDCLILDRGFRDVIGIINASKVLTFMPHCLDKGQDQFSAEQANESRKITKLRWVVEAANGRLKNVFSFFHETISAAYFPKLNRFLRIAVAIQNAFFVPLFTETPEHIRMAEEMNQADVRTNNLEEKVERLQLERRSVKRWEEANEDGILVEFPDLNMDELSHITLGSYQFGPFA